MAAQTPKGTKDYLPDEMARRTAVFDAFRRVFLNYDYGEIATPAFEYLKTLSKEGGTGEESETQFFKIQSRRRDEQAEDTLALRYDMTTPVCRVLAANPNLRKPVKWFYITNMWRYENPQKGRMREFWQAGMENIGSRGDAADAEVLAVTYDALARAGITGFVFKINSREVLDKLADSLCLKDKAEFYKALDKRGKLSPDEWEKWIREIMAPESAARFLELARGPAEGLLAEMTGAVGEGAQRLQRIMGLAADMGVPRSAMAFDISIVRGLDYYTGFVFETFMTGREDIGSIASGGRYDNLISVEGGEPTPATGMAIGIERVMGLVPDSLFEGRVRRPVYLLPLDASAEPAAVSAARALRARDVPCSVERGEKSLKKRLGDASERGIEYCVLIGEKEVREKTFTVKNMVSGTQTLLDMEGMVDAVGKPITAADRVKKFAEKG